MKGKDMPREYLAKLTVSVFIEREDGKLLMVQEGNPKCYERWSQPGGHVEHWEDPATAAIRETKEETGYTIRLVSNFVTYICPPNEVDAYFMNYCFRGVLKKHQRSNATDPEILKEAWFSREELKLFKQDQYRSDLTIFRTADWLHNGYQSRGFVRIAPRGQRKDLLRLA